MSSWILKACDFCGLVHGAKAGAFAYSIKCLRVELKVEEKGEIKAHSGTNFGKYIARDLLPNVLP
jgi:hypothetical protein